jgi:hypothetical protein
MNWASDQEYPPECHLCSAFTDLLLTGQVGCEAYVAVALFLLSAGLNTFTVPGCKTSMLDMAPAYSGTTLYKYKWCHLCSWVMHRTMIKGMISISQIVFFVAFLPVPIFTLLLQL